MIVTGYDLGMNTDGGFGEYIRVPAAWCVPMPDGWNARTAMIYGTAGLTAGLCVQKLLTMGAKPEQGKVAVSGASGAVGTVAVELLSEPRLRRRRHQWQGKTMPTISKLWVPRKCWGAKPWQPKRSQC